MSFSILPTHGHGLRSKEAPGGAPPQGEQSAEQVDADGSPVQRSYGLHIRSVRDDKREADFVASTDALDSWDEIVEQVWRLERFLANPVVLFAHQSRELPIGQCTAVGVVDGKLECTIKFATEKANPKAEQVWQSVKEKTLRAVSVGFAPNEYRWEMRNGQEVLVLSDNELHEISVVPIPANPEALAKMRSKAREAYEAKRGSAEPTQQAAEGHTETSMNLEEAKAKLAERDAEINTLKASSDSAMKRADGAEKALAEEREAHSKTKSELTTATKSAADAKDKLIELEVEAFVGVKITPAEKEVMVELAKANRPIFDKQMAAKPNLRMTTPVIPTGIEAGATKAAAGSADEALAEMSSEGIED